MNKAEFKQFIEREVYGPYREGKKSLSLFDKYWCKYLSPSLNAVYLIRKKQLLESGGKASRLLSKYYRIKLMRRYNIHVNSKAKIGLGLTIVHPMCISIAESEIGDNFTLYQSCTVGAKKIGNNSTPTIGNNVTMYCGSAIIGNCKVCDNVSLGANSLLINDALEPGNYVGSPAVKK